MRLDTIGIRSSMTVDLFVQSTRPLPNPLTLQIPSHWAGFDDLDQDIEVGGAHGEVGPLTDRRMGSRLLVEHNGETSIRVRYRIVPRYQQLARPSRFHAVGGPDYLVAYGRNLFIWPTHLNPESQGLESRVDIRFENGPNGTQWATTLGFVAPSGALNDLDPIHVLDSVYLAGRMRIRESTHEDITVVIDPQLGSVEDQILPLLERITSYASARFGQTPIETSVVFALRREDDRLVLTGSGRPGGIVAEMGEAARPNQASMALLIAHEHLHRYIGTWMRFAVEDELSTLWFKEGVVDYLAAQFAIRSGAIPSNAFTAELSDVLTEYLTRSSALETLPRDESTFWHNPGLRRLPYSLGFLVALRLDTLLRQQGDSLERAVLDLLQENAGQRRVSMADLRAHFEQRLDEDLDPIFAACSLGGSPIPVRDWLADLELSLRPLNQAAHYYGVEFDVHRDGRWWVTAVDPMGPAAGLPISAGDRLVGAPSFPSSGVGRLVVERNGRQLAVRIPGVPGVRRVFGVQDDGETLGRLMRW